MYSLKRLPEIPGDFTAQPYMWPKIHSVIQYYNNYSASNVQ